MNEIYRTATQCRNFLETHLSISRNKIHYNNLLFTDYDINGNTNKLKPLLIDLSERIKFKHPEISINLRNSINQFRNDPIIHFSMIQAILDCLISIESQNSGKSIFISHSSKDKTIVEAFVDHILCLGIGIDRNDIFCTSIEDLAIKNGEDIRKHIQNTIRVAEYSFLLISDNYKSSEICINEMGAVWAYDANVRTYLLPNSDFNDIGWLNDPRKADKIENRVALDNLYEEMQEFYSIKNSVKTWGQQKEAFIRLLDK